MAYRFPPYNPNAEKQIHNGYVPWNQPPMSCQTNSWSGSPGYNNDGLTNVQNQPFSNVSHGPGNFQLNPYGAPHQQRVGYSGRGHRGRGRRQNGVGTHADQPGSYHKAAENSDVPASALQCEPCEKWFSSQNDFVAHQRTHIECHFEGCTFTASKKMVTLHFIKNHEEGKFKICLDTPEEIAQWRAQRKRCFPTKENIARKLALQEQRRQSGINLKTKSFKYRNQQCIRCCGRRGRGRGRRGRGRGRYNNEDSGCSCWRNGISSDDYQALVSSSKTDPINTPAKNKESQGIAKAVSSSGGSLGLLSSYNSDDDSSNDSNQESTSPASTRPVDTETNATCSPVKSKEENCKREDNNSKRWKAKRKNNKRQPAKTTKHGNLLEMLLAQDIRHERNVILQCVRYIVNQNFFDE